MNNTSVVCLLDLDRELLMFFFHIGMNKFDRVEYSLTKTLLRSDIFSAHSQKRPWSKRPVLYLDVPSYGGSQYITLPSGISSSSYGRELKVNAGMPRSASTVLLKLFISSACLSFGFPPSGVGVSVTHIRPTVHTTKRGAKKDIRG